MFSGTHVHSIATVDNPFVNRAVEVRIELIDRSGYVVDEDASSAVVEVTNDDYYRSFVALADGQDATVTEGETITLELKRCVIPNAGSTPRCEDPADLPAGLVALPIQQLLSYDHEGDFTSNRPQSFGYANLELIKILQIDTLDDQIDEKDGSLTVKVAGLNNSRPDQAVEIRILDNDFQQVWIERAPDIEEGNDFGFEIHRSAVGTELTDSLPVTLEYSYVGPQQDLDLVALTLPATQELTIGAGNPYQRFTVDTVRNNKVTGPVVVNIRIVEDTDGRYELVGTTDKPSSAQVRIADLDEYALFVGHAPGADRNGVIEGDPALFKLSRCVLNGRKRFCVDPDNPSPGVIAPAQSFDLHVTATGDLHDTLPTAVEFAEGEFKKILRIDTIDDADHEFNGSVTVAAVAQDAGAGQQHEVLVWNDDYGPPQVTWLEVVSATAEGQSFTYRIHRSGTAPQVANDLCGKVEFSLAEAAGEPAIFSPALPHTRGWCIYPTHPYHQYYPATTRNYKVTGPVGVTLTLLDDPDPELEPWAVYTFSADADKPRSVTFDVADVDEYALFVKLPGGAPTKVNEGASIVLEFERCVFGADAEPICEDPLNPRPGVIAPAQSFELFYETTGNYFDALPATVDFTDGAFTTTLQIGTVDDQIAEPQGRIVIATDATTGRPDQMVAVTVEDDNDRPTLSIYSPERVTEGDSVTFTMVREESELFDEEPIRVDLGYHRKLFDAGNKPGVIHRLTFAEGERSIALVIPTDGDELNEGDGKVEARIVSAGHSAIGTRETWTRVVDDDLPIVTLAVDKTEVVDGDSSVTWTLTRTGDTNGVLILDTQYEIVHRYPAIWGDQVDAGSNEHLSLTQYFSSIPSGAASRRVRDCSFGTSVSVCDDVTGPLGGYEKRRVLPFPDPSYSGIPSENHRTFWRRYTPATTDWVRVDIANTNQGVKIERDATEIDEGQNVSFTLTRYGGVYAAQIVELRLNLRITADGEFLDPGELGDRVVRFAPHEPTAKLILATIDDDVAEADGSVTVTLLAAASTGFAEDSYEFRTDPLPGTSDVYHHKAQVGVADNDLRALTVSGGSGSESEGMVEFTLGLDAPAEVVSTIDYDISSEAGDTATEDLDYTGTAGTVRFDIGSRQEVISVAVLDDNDAEGDETFTLSLRNARHLSAVDASVTGTIVDDDTAAVVLTALPTAVAEGAGGQTVAVTAVLSAEVLASDTVVDISVSADTAAATDFVPVPAFAVTIAAGLSSATGHFSLAPTADAVDEDDELVVVSGVAGDLSVSSTGVRIEDDDRRGVTVSATALTVAEGETGAYGVVLDSEPTGPVTVAPGLGNAAGVTLSPATLTFTATDWATALTVTVSATEDSDAEDEAAMITHEVSGGDYDSVTSDDVAVAVLDDDTASTTVILSLDESSVVEGNGARTITVTGTLDGATRAGPTEVTVSVSADTASGDDFAPVDDFTLTIDAGDRAGEATFALAPAADDVDEEGETVGVGGATAGLDVTGTRITIEDDDTRGVRLSRSALTVPEGSSGEYTVALTSNPTGAVTVMTTATGDADVMVAPESLTFAASNWSVPQVVTVSARGDVDGEDDAATIGHTVSGGDYAGQSAEAVAVTVSDDEAASTTVSLSVDERTVEEDGGGQAIVVTGTLNGAPRAQATAVMVTVGRTGDLAVEGTDYGTVADVTVTIAASQTSGSETFTLTPTDDAVDEPDETVSVTGTATGLDVTGTTVTLIDDDATPTVTLALSDVSIGENGESATVTATLDHPSSEATTVEVSAAGDNTLSANTTLTITAGATTSSGVVTITAVNNAVDAADTTVTVSADATNSQGVIGPSDLTLTIMDDDMRGIEVDPTRLAVPEGDSRTYTVVLESEPSGPVTVTPRVEGNSDVTVSPAALTFTATTWETEQEVTVDADEDADAEQDSRR